MISKHYGRNIPLQTLRNKSRIGKDGVNLLGISEAAESVGFRTRPIRIGLSSLAEEIRLPAILHWNKNHFVVLYKVKKSVFYVADPGAGTLKLNISQFTQNWVSFQEKEQEEGIALLLEPTQDFYEQTNNYENNERSDHFWRSILSYLQPYKKLIVQLTIGLLLGSFLQLLLPFLAQSVIDVGVNTANLHFLYLVLLAQLALFIGKLSIEIIRSWTLQHISTRINISILTEFIIKLMKLPVSYFESKKTGDILQRMSDHQRIESFLTGSSLNVLFSLINLAVFSMVLAVFSTGIFIVFISSVLIYALWILIFLNQRRQLDYRRFDIAAKEQSALVQMVQAMQEIRLNGVEKQLRWEWEFLQAGLFRVSMKELSLNQWQRAGAFLINEGKNILITFLAAKSVIDGDMTLGAMMAVQYIVGQLNSPVEQMVGFIQSFQNAKISIERLNEIKKMEDEEPFDRPLFQELPYDFSARLMGGRTSPGHPVEEQIRTYETHYETYGSMPEMSGITINNLSFTYNGAGNEPVLKGISLRIATGTTTAIVGTSGSGKTTLLKLLLKFHEPQQGNIYLGGTPLSGISHKIWRQHCGAVMQESFVFSATIAQNIALGEEVIDIKRLYYAMNIANVKEFVDKLPLGYNTLIGSEGNGISMGQKQRILIARAVYRDPDFLFFDEATNSLDANNETDILQKLSPFLQSKTVVVVAHRLSTVRHADQIIVLKKGRIAEMGTHEELVELKEEYYNLVKNQLELGQ